MKNGRLLHQVAGVLTVLLFLGTGFFMLFHRPPLAEFELGKQVLFRSGHIYLLMSGLVNLAMASYGEPPRAGRFRALRRVGSLLLLVAPLLLAVGFFVESVAANPERRLTQAGVMAVFLGTMCHFVASRFSGVAKKDRAGDGA